MTTCLEFIQDQIEYTETHIDALDEYFTLIPDDSQYHDGHWETHLRANRGCPSRYLERLVDDICSGMITLDITTAYQLSSPRPHLASFPIGEMEISIPDDFEIDEDAKTEYYINGRYAYYPSDVIVVFDLSIKAVQEAVEGYIEVDMD